MYWMGVWRLGPVGVLGGFTSGGVGLVVGMSGVGGWRRSALLRIGLVLRGAGCTAAGTWRAGAGMGFWSLWGVRTIRLRFAVSALSLGRSRPRWLGTRAFRRRLFLRGRIGRGARGLMALLVLVVRGGGRGGGGWGGVAVACWIAATRLHGAVSDRCIGSSSADGEREAGPWSAACAAGSRWGSAFGAQSARGVAVRAVCRGIGIGACWD